MTCNKCHDTGVHFQHEYGPDAITSTAKWCDCPIAQTYLAHVRQRFVGLKSRLSLVQRDILERMAQLAKNPK